MVTYILMSEPLLTTQSIQPVDKYPNPQDKEIAPDVQRYFSNPDPLKILFNIKLAGWRLYQEDEITEQLGLKSHNMVTKIWIDENSKIGNEELSSYCCATVMPLISQLTQTSNLTKEIIYDIWNAPMRSLKWELLDSYYIDGNPYKIKDHTKIPTIISFCCEFYGITQKGLEGFLMAKYSDSYQTIVGMRNGVPPPEKKPPTLIGSVLNSIPHL